MSNAPTEIIDSSLFESLLARARTSPRLRTNHNFHRSMEENPHRFLNVMWNGTYIAPHRHLYPPKAESFLVLEGEVAFFEFEDDGSIRRVTVLGQDPVGIDIQPGVWHTMAVLSESAICFEVKPGPYAVSNDKEFAQWAPREGDPRVAEYQKQLLSHVPRPM
jgi:cupin fold WbuC family metalloprotein